MGERKHGLCERGNTHPLFKLWYDMLYRCSNKKKSNYKYYGGRGISVCDRWKNFANFVADMGARPPQTTLDRIDHNGNYEPSNCRWATKLEQANNTRANRMLDVCGQLMTLAEAERTYDIKRTVISKRLKSGWSTEQAVRTPVRPHKPYAWKRAQDGIR